MIRAQNVNFKIGRKEILSDINIDIKCGKMTAILGANGAGKSTLLKCLTGLEKPFSGKVMLGDEKLSHYSLQELSQKRAVFSQSQIINFPFTAMQIVQMGRSPYLSKNKIQDDQSIIEHILKKVDAWHLKDRILSNLSGGEQQRIHLARVLAQIWNKKNACLFLDEPTSALDLKHQHQIMQITQSLSRTYNVMICVIIHDISLAYYYADEVILMKNGAIFASGSKEYILNPQNLSVTFDMPTSYFSHYKREKSM